jgi:hypothetical protein
MQYEVGTQSRRRAISLPRSFGGTLNSSIARSIAAAHPERQRRCRVLPQFENKSIG